MMTFIRVKVRVGGARERERVSIAGGVDPRLFHTRHAHMLRDILKQESHNVGQSGTGGVYERVRE